MLCRSVVSVALRFKPDGSSVRNCNAPQETSGTVQSANIKLSDTVIDGNVTITQNNADDIASAMVQALERLGFSGQSSPSELTAEQTAQVEQVLEVSEQLAGHGIEIHPTVEITLGMQQN